MWILLFGLRRPAFDTGFAGAARLAAFRNQTQVVPTKMPSLSRADIVSPEARAEPDAAGALSARRASESEKEFRPADRRH
jgi:hypothetical protein